jgi:hypothetical protein
MHRIFPDKNWPQIRALIQEIMDKGFDGISPSGDFYKIKFAYVNNHPVIVRYRPHEDGINRISRVLVAEKETINMFIPQKYIRT